MLSNFEIFTGRRKHPDTPETYLSERIVVGIAKVFEVKWHQVYFDYYTRTDPLLSVQENKCYAWGNVCTNKKNLLTGLKDNKEMNRGDFNWAVNRRKVFCSVTEGVSIDKANIKKYYYPFIDNTENGTIIYLGTF